MTRRLAPALKRLAFENRAKGNIKKEGFIGQNDIIADGFLKSGSVWNGGV